MKTAAVIVISLLAVAGIFWVTYAGMQDRPVAEPEPPPPVPTKSLSLMPGDPAPDFTLPSARGEEQITFTKFRDGRPAVLVFGSFTCDLFCARTDELERLHQNYKDRAKFLFVNITEAGHKIEGLEFMFRGGLPDSHTPLEDWRAKVERATAARGFTMPAVIAFNNPDVEAAYFAHPLRMYALDADGRIAIDMGRVAYDKPWDFNKLEDWLKKQPK